MRKNLLKNLLRKSILGVAALGMAILPCALPTATVSASGYNEYQGRTYETAEELQELEETLTEDGYVCISDGKCGNEEYRELLQNTEDFYFNFVIEEDNPEDGLYYFVYVLPQDCEDLIAAKESNARKIILNAEAVVNENAILVSYYEVGYDVDSESNYLDLSTVTGEDVGQLTITCPFVNKEVADSNTSVWVVIYGTERDQKAQIEVSAFSGYETIVTLPSDVWQVDSVTIGDGYYAEYDTKLHRVSPDTSWELELTVKSIDGDNDENGVTGKDVSPADGESGSADDSTGTMTESQALDVDANDNIAGNEFSNGSADVTSVGANDSAGMTDSKSETTLVSLVKIVLIICGAVAVVAAVIAGIIAGRKKNK